MYLSVSLQLLVDANNSTLQNFNYNIFYVGMVLSESNAVLSIKTEKKICTHNHILSCYKFHILAMMTNSNCNSGAHILHLPFPFSVQIKSFYGKQSHVF